ncbi:MAG: DMT family transporter [Chloroflexi bacterium]|nr:DMT family transporter [Chloroflexota bacterium]
MVIGIVLGLASAFVWATTSLAMKTQSEQIDALSANTFRMIVAAILFLLLLPFFGGLDALAQISDGAKLALAVSFIFGVALGDTLYFWSMTQIGAARAMPLSSIYPLFTWAMAVPILGEPITFKAIIGTALVLIGVYLLTPRISTQPVISRSVPSERSKSKDRDEKSHSSDSEISRGVYSERSEAARNDIESNARAKRIGTLAAIVAALLWAISTTLLKMGLQDGLNVVVINSFRMPVGALVMLAMVYGRLGKQAWRGIHRQNLLSLILVGIYSTGIGMTLWTLSVEYTGAARAALLVTLAPLIGVPLSVFLLKERITRAIVIGTGICVAGIWLIL